MYRWRVLSAAVFAAMALGGCGLGIRLPTSTDAGAAVGSGTGTTVTAPSRMHGNELPTRPGPDESAPPANSAQVALKRFASVYINWNAADVKRRLLELAADSVGQARTAMQLEAAQTGADPELRQAGIVNRGRVEAVSSLAGSRRRYVVITLESTSATDSAAYEGLTAAWHLTVATVTRRGRGWLISGWQPES